MSGFDNYEETGKGMLTILRDYTPDVFELDSDDLSSFTVSLPFNPLACEDTTSTVNSTVNSTEKLGENIQSLNPAQLKILSLMQSNSKTTYIQLPEAVHIGEEAVGKNIKTLVERKIIQRVGPDKGGPWEIIPNE